MSAVRYSHSQVAIIAPVQCLTGCPLFRRGVRYLEVIQYKGGKHLVHTMSIVCPLYTLFRVSAKSVTVRPWCTNYPVYV